jgi:hypothetical protein
MFGDYVQKRARKFVISKLFSDITTSESSVKGTVSKGSFISQALRSFLRKYKRIKNIFFLVDISLKTICTFVYDTG